SKKTVDMVNVLTNSKIPYDKGEERVNMCQALEGLIRRGEARGRAEGEAKGRAEGEARGRAEGRLETLKNAAANMRAEGFDDETIARILSVDVADVRIWLDTDVN
ncbi:MAG: hypothetical protein IJM54_10165, partial [Thermoguttaceae bacterium]|nr:hypothetical protein [Thermoguttaceae bacterium]